MKQINPIKYVVGEYKIDKLYLPKQKLLTNNESSTSSNSSANDTKSSIEKTIIEKIQN